MKWKGINRKSSPVDDDHSVSHYEENGKHVIEGELRRRNGMARSSIEKIATPIYGIASTVAPVASVAIQGSVGSIFGYTGFTPLWGDAQLLAPTGTAVNQGGTSYITGDSTDYSMPYSVPSTFSAPFTHAAAFNSGAQTLNTDGANGATYRLLIIMSFSVSDGVGLDSIALKATHSVAGDNTIHGNSWVSGGNPAGTGTQGDQNTTTIGQTFAGPLVIPIPISLAGTVQPYAVSYGGTHLYAGGSTVTFDVNADASSPFPTFAFTMSGLISFTTTKQVISGGDQWLVTVNRADAFDTSYDIYAKLGSYPSDPSDGVFISNLSINPSSGSTSATLTSPTDSTGWKWIAVPRYGSMQGPQGLLV